jgi:hypothetical protein
MRFYKIKEKKTAKKIDKKNNDYICKSVEKLKR